MDEITALKVNLYRFARRDWQREQTVQMVGLDVDFDRETAEAFERTAYIGMEIGANLVRQGSFAVLRREDEMDVDFGEGLSHGAGDSSTCLEICPSGALAAFQAARRGCRCLLTQGIGLRPQPRAMLSRPVGPVLLGALIGLLVPMVRDTLRYKHNAKLTGEWCSAWPDPAAEQPQWIVEKVAITAEHGKVQLKSIGNPKGYNWEGSGELYEDEYFHGTRKSTNPASKAKGTFMFSFLPEGRTLVGQAIGPDQNGRLISMSWAMGRDDESLELGKRWLNSQAHAKVAA